MPLTEKSQPGIENFFRYQSILLNLYIGIPVLKKNVKKSVAIVFVLVVSYDALVKSPQIPFSVIPAKAEIRSFQAVAGHLNSSFHRSDDFLRAHQVIIIFILNGGLRNEED